MKRRVSLLLSVAMLMCMVLAAFGPGALADETVYDITWMPAGGSGSYVLLDSEVEKILEQRYHVNLTIYQVQANKAEQTNLMLAANDMPDCAFLYKTVDEMYDTGLIRSIPESMIREYMPDYAAFLDNSINGWLINKYPDGDGGFVEGEYAAISGYNGQNSGAFYTTMMRYDWLKNLGIEAPGEVEEIYPGIYWCEEPYSIDEFTDIIRAFRDDDPDQNGEKDTYGLSGTLANYTRSIYHYTGAFGVKNLGIFMENGVVQPYYHTEAWKNMLSWISDLYNGGYVDPEWVTYTDATYQETFSNGQLGIMTLNRDCIKTQFSDRPPHALLQKTPGASVLITPAVVDGSGNGGSPHYNDTPFAYTTYINKNVDDGKLAVILSMLNDITSDAETFVTVTYGIPGKSFDWEGEPWNSAAITKVGLTTEEKGLYALEAYSVFFRRPEFTKFMIFSAQNVLYTFANSERGIAWTTLQNEYIDYLGKYRAELLDWQDFYKSECDAVYLEYFADATTGADVGATWDAYLNELESRASISKYLDIIAQYDNTADTYGLVGYNVGK